MMFFDKVLLKFCQVSSPYYVLHGLIWRIIQRFVENEF